MFDRLKSIIGRRDAADREAHHRLRQLMLGLNLKGSKNEDLGNLRKLAVSLGKAAMRPAELAQTLTNLSKVEDFHHAETETWLKADAIAAGQSGPFEAASLTSWLAIAEKAGVRAIPAKVVLKLTDAESEAASGTLPHFSGPVPDAIRRRLRNAVASNEDLSDMLAAEPSRDEPVDRALLVEKLHAAMDDLPFGPDVMVRSDQCGPSTLKALACTGLADDHAPEVEFGPDLQIGPGWVRNGNRRRIDVSDARILKSYVAGRHDGLTFVARPWVRASRYIEGRDPHRAGTPFDTPGLWPAEWRAFIKNGKVIGVSSYYCFVEEATPFTATRALEVRDLAQRIVDTAIEQGLEPRYADTEHARRRPEFAALMEEHGFAPGSFSASLDFLETDDGMTLLEGGPGHMPFGGAHACGFAGISGAPVLGNEMQIEGVAFRVMDHVNLGDPSTWCDGNREGRILSWDDVEALAEQAA